MAGPGLFKDLPTTFPVEDERGSVIGSVVFRIALIVIVMVVPLFMSERLSEQELAVGAPVGPPPSPPPAPIETPAGAASKVVRFENRPAAPDVPVMSAAISEQIDKNAESSSESGRCMPDEAAAGVPDRFAQDILGKILAATSAANPLLAAPPPSPPPPPEAAIAPAGFVRIGGMVKQPRSIKLVPPVYPPLAAAAGVTGAVILEAVVTEEGTVEDVRVNSGHPLLIQAAVDCVKQWQYEPTMLNGTPVRVILNARVLFSRPIT